MRARLVRQLTLFFSLGLIPLAIVYAHELPAEEVEGENQRYKIFIAEHNALVNGKPINMKSVFKIDLETGTVWRYRQGIDSKGKPFEEFFEVPNQ
jgi:hypothetical protein